MYSCNIRRHKRSRYSNRAVTLIFDCKISLATSRGRLLTLTIRGYYRHAV